MFFRDTLEYAFNLRNFPSLIYEKMNRPQVEVKESLELVNRPIIICRNEEEKIEIEPSINSVRINIVTTDNKLDKKFNREAFAVCWSALSTVEINCNTNCMQKKPKTIKARVLSSAAILDCVFNIFDQSRKGFIQKINTRTTPIIIATRAYVVLI